MRLIEHPESAELAARSLCRLAGLPEDAEVNGIARWQKFLPQVLTVLTAIREPTIEMTMACDDERGCVGSHAAIFRLMIDAAIDSGRTMDLRQPPARIAA